MHDWPHITVTAVDQLFRWPSAASDRGLSGDLNFGSDTIMRAFILSLSLTGLAVGDNSAQSRVETTATVPADMDRCLDHTIKELGMSAKPKEGERAWNIAPKFLHPSIATDGSLSVRFEKLERESKIVVLATWAGAPKEKAIQDELEERLRAMAHKMAQLCGVTNPQVLCQRTPSGGKPSTCTVSS